MPGNPLSDPTWAKQLADTIERVVANVRDKTTNNIVLAARGIVFGLLAAMLGIVAITLLLVGLTRGIQALLDLAVTPERAVYLSYFIVGGICCLLGWFLMRKRHTPGA
jgi:uncharacterized protein YacL